MALVTTKTTQGDLSARDAFVRDVTQVAPAADSLTKYAYHIDGTDKVGTAAERVYYNSSNGATHVRFFAKPDALASLDDNVANHMGTTSNAILTLNHTNTIIKATTITLDGALSLSGALSQGGDLDMAGNDILNAANLTGGDKTKFTFNNAGSTIGAYVGTNPSSAMLSIDTTGVTITGNLTVQGTQTVVNSTEINVGDKNIVLANDATTLASIDGGGITIGKDTGFIGTRPTWTYDNTKIGWTSSVPVVLGSTVKTELSLDGEIKIYDSGATTSVQKTGVSVTNESSTQYATLSPTGVNFGTAAALSWRLNYDVENDQMTLDRYDGETSAWVTKFTFSA